MTGNGRQSTQKVGSITSCRSGNESAPLFLLPFLGDEKELRKSSLNTRMRKMFIQSVTQVAWKKKVRILAIGVLSYYLLLLVSSDSLPLIKLLETRGS